MRDGHTIVCTHFAAGFRGVLRFRFLAAFKSCSFYPEKIPFTLHSGLTRRIGTSRCKDGVSNPPVSERTWPHKYCYWWIEAKKGFFAINVLYLITVPTKNGHTHWFRWNSLQAFCCILYLSLLILCDVSWFWEPYENYYKIVEKFHFPSFSGYSQNHNAHTFWGKLVRMWEKPWPKLRVGQFSAVKPKDISWGIVWQWSAITGDYSSFRYSSLITICNLGNTTVFNPLLMCPCEPLIASRRPSDLPYLIMLLVWSNL